MRLTNKKILITGGASGIGLGLAEKFIEENNTVIICGRRQETLKKVSDRFPSIIVKRCDLSLEADRISLFTWISEYHSDLNVLVNNAGIQNWMNISDSDFYKKATDEITTNVLAPIHLTALFMQLSSLDTIMNVSSGLAFIQFAKVPIYCATKAFSHSFTMSLRYQLKDKNIKVIEIIPPALNTDLGGKGLHDKHPPVSDFIKSIFLQLKEGKMDLPFESSEKMANADPIEIKKIFKLLNP